MKTIFNTLGIVKMFTHSWYITITVTNNFLNRATNYCRKCGALDLFFKTKKNGSMCINSASAWQLEHEYFVKCYYEKNQSNNVIKMYDFFFVITLVCHPILSWVLPLCVLCTTEIKILENKHKGLSQKSCRNMKKIRFFWLTNVRVYFLWGSSKEEEFGYIQEFLR